MNIWIGLQLGANRELHYSSSQEFNQDTARAQKAAAHGPVFITDRGRPTHVLLTIERYQELSGRSTSIVSQLSMPKAGDVDCEPPRAELYRAADLS